MTSVEILYILVGCSVLKLHLSSLLVYDTKKCAIFHSHSLFWDICTFFHFDTQAE